MLHHKILSGVLVLAGTSFAAGAIAEPDTSAATTGKSTSEHSTSKHSMPTASFEQLDADQDGYISETEAKVSPTLAMKTEELDQNGDGKLDRTEFSAFESAGSTTSPSTGHTTDPSKTSETTEPMEEQSESDY